MTRVYLAQLLCPNRHAIIAVADEANDETAIKLGDKVVQEADGLIASGVLNPWCGLCHSPRPSWTCDVRPTAFRTLEEATPSLRQSEAGNIAYGVAYGELLGPMNGTKH